MTITPQKGFRLIEAKTLSLSVANAAASFEVGACASSIHEVEEEDLDIYYGGECRVLASAILMRHIGVACSKMTGWHMPRGFVTLGVAFDLLQLVPAKEGDCVQIDVALDQVSKATLRFSVQVSNQQGLIATGSHVRQVVEKEGYGVQNALRDVN